MPIAAAAGCTSLPSRSTVRDLHVCTMALREIVASLSREDKLMSHDMRERAITKRGVSISLAPVTFIENSDNVARRCAGTENEGQTCTPSPLERLARPTSFCEESTSLCPVVPSLTSGTQHRFLPRRRHIVSITISFGSRHCLSDLSAPFPRSGGGQNNTDKDNVTDALRLRMS